METPSDKLLELSRALYIIADDIFGRLMLLTKDELERIDRIAISKAEPVDDSNDIRSVVLKMEQFIDKTIDVFRHIRHDEESRNYLRHLGSDAVWRFMRLGDLVESDLRPLFHFFCSPLRFQEKHESNMQVMQTIKACIDFSEWLELLCEEPKANGSALDDIENEIERLSGQALKLFKRLFGARIPKQDRPGRPVTFKALMQEKIVDSQDEESVKQAVKRLNKQLQVTNIFEAKMDGDRVRLARIAPDK
jgi:hypothetical protein